MHDRHVVRIIKIKLMNGCAIAQHGAGSGHFHAAAADQRAARASTPRDGNFANGDHIVTRRAREHAAQCVEY